MLGQRDPQRRLFGAQARLVPEEAARELDVERYLEAGSSKGSEVVDWDDEGSVSRFIAGLLADGARVVRAAEQADCAAEEVALLRTVVAENVDQSEEGPKIARGVSKERTTSIHDPDMRHGHKSSGKLYTGHKAHFATDTKSQIITAVALTAPSKAEGSQVAPLVMQTRELTGAVVDEGLGDCAYSTRKAQAQAKAVGIELKTKMPSPPKGRLGPRDFDVSEDRETATCPAGHPSDKLHRPKNGDRVHWWLEGHCTDCPLRERRHVPSRSRTSMETVSGSFSGPGSPPQPERRKAQRRRTRMTAA